MSLSITPDPLNLWIAGSRSLNDYVTIGSLLDVHVAHMLDIIEPTNRKIRVWHGGARGVDTCAGAWAKTRGHEVSVIKPEWGKHGRAAGAIRNVELAKRADFAIILWDGESKGTKHAIELCQKYGIPHRLYTV